MCYTLVCQVQTMGTCFGHLFPFASSVPSKAAFVQGFADPFLNRPEALFMACPLDSNAALSDQHNGAMRGKLFKSNAINEKWLPSVSVYSMQKGHILYLLLTKKKVRIRIFLMWQMHNVLTNVISSAQEINDGCKLHNRWKMRSRLLAPSPLMKYNKKDLHLYRAFLDIEGQHINFSSQIYNNYNNKMYFLNVDLKC